MHHGCHVYPARWLCASSKEIRDANVRCSISLAALARVGVRAGSPAASRLRVTVCGACNLMPTVIKMLQRTLDDVVVSLQFRTLMRDE